MTIKVRYFNKKIECADRKELEKLQKERLLSLVRRVYDKVPFYKEKFNQIGINPEDVKSLEDLKKLPFTVKDDLRKNFPYKLFAEPLKKVVRIHASSGTTGIPTVVGYTKNDIKLWSELTARVLKAGGLSNNDIVQISFGYGLFTGAFGMHYGAERIGATVIPISTGNTIRQITTIQNFGTTALICTPSYALQIYDTAKEHGIDLRNTSLKLGFFGAEPWTETMRKEIEEKMGILATDNYGLSEIIGPGFSGECIFKKGLHIAEDHFIPEIINPETGEVLEPGEIGELVITTLTKEAIPLIRYRTKDLTKLNYEKCECGRTLVRMEKVKGRSDDMLIIKGVNVFPTQIETALLSVKGILPYYLIIVDKKGRLDSLEVQTEIESEILFSEETKKTLLNNLKNEFLKILGFIPDITLLPPNTLKRTEGKAVRVIDKRQSNG